MKLTVSITVTGLQVSSPARHSVPHVNDQSGFGSLSTRHHLHSAGQGDLVVPRTRTARFGPRSFSVAGPLAWNSLPLEIKTTSLTLGQFSSRLKTEMFLYVVTTPQHNRHNFYSKPT